MLTGNEHAHMNFLSIRIELHANTKSTLFLKHVERTFRRSMTQYIPSTVPF